MPHTKNRDERLCPFCLGIAKESVDDNAQQYSVRIRCAECHAFGPRKNTKEKAWAAWNRRDGESNSEIAIDYGVYSSTIQKIRKGTNWSHVKI